MRFFFALCAVAFYASAVPAHAAQLTKTSDLISTSRPSIAANHTISFIAASAIPFSGKITVTPQSGSFDIPALFSYADVDIAVAPISGTYAERSAGASPSATADGVSVVPGSSGSLTFTLNATTGIGAGESVRIKLGTHAVFEATGAQQLLNPAVENSYRFTIRTFTGADALLDAGIAMIAIISPVSIGPVDTTDTTPPSLSNGLPAGALPGGTLYVELSLNTDEYALCRFATAPDTAYDAMPSTFTNTASTFHTTTVGPFVNGQAYAYYIRCRDRVGNKTLSDFIISFSISEIPPPPPPPSPPGNGIPSTVTAYPPPPTTSSVTLEGLAYPFAAVTVLKDGKTERTLTANAEARFSTTVSGLERGVYTFGIIAKDTDDRKSITYPSTFSIQGGTNTTVGNIFIPPTVSAAKAMFSAGEDIVISGQSAPDATIEVLLTHQTGTITDASAITQEVIAGKDGKWTAVVGGSGLAVDTYEFKARARHAQFGQSDYGRLLYIGVGKPPSLDLAKRSDLNRDGRVNLVDFSILLFHWGKDNPLTDINANGKVDLTDFSIMIFNWTG
ncbi:hypothetical protein A3C91_03470 [Candidatus Azambacteria bacterium RIFCSPHIGHO2_02_FULL_52_12]|uniref:Dockerin domain-containing protein n=1 Tax=Candidatus Azambacteria bacterium RIFCSPLOWO2_01_FULL_46_25 TaxID=1797298 RepID=A0A1F5BUU3_9BACT|nr:MAG: hypothetical protein A3C91_03470 [Candidatus Azambacteria bacterium RIFCSPHIGHO2_02_FULL_52_12]OGD34387.1 MAG: hypothetical protein A2988_02565 [Candidatus Azambacteria bacterium RIFCSPLOWO2_01_FULL_46_25]OGD37335.1 MAG: hypothetical protein A2850_01320 [Candidatus Azambacteria bacterium RIFCSPHIGHO2_01_FULL_51_74]